MTKAFGRDINEFWNTGFPVGHYIEDDAEWIEKYYDEDLLKLPENEKFELKEFGVLVDQSTQEAYWFSAMFKRWQKEQTTATIAIEVKKENLESAIEQLKGLGFKVIK